MSDQSYQPNKSRVPCGTACLVYLRSGELIMLRRKGSHGAGKWTVPGGWVEKGEDPAEAVIREVWEEAGITVLATEFLGYTHDVHPEGVEDICLWFRAVDWAGVARNTNPDRADAIEFVLPKDLARMPREQLFLPLDNLIEKGIVTL